MKISTLSSSSQIYLFKCSNLTNPTTISPFLIPTKPNSHLKHHTHHLPNSSQSLNNLKNPKKLGIPILEFIPNCQKVKVLTNGYQRFVSNFKSLEKPMLELTSNCQEIQVLANGWERFVSKLKPLEKSMNDLTPDCEEIEVLSNGYERILSKPKTLENPMMELIPKSEEAEVLANGYQRFVVMGAICAGIVLFLVGIDGEKALALGPEGPLVEEFWDNVRRYALYALTVSTGAIYTIVLPIVELLKNPISAILILVILGGGFYIVSQVVSAMVGVTDFNYEYYY